MDYKQVNIKDGIKLHIINNDKFKTNLISIMITTKLERNNVTKNALIPSVLRRGTKRLNTQEKIDERLEEMYGASLDCGLDKTGDNQVLKFYIETINDDFLPQNNEKMLENSIKEIFDLVFDPYTENGYFKKGYVEQEKERLKQIIEGKKDNKSRYAINRCIEEMYKNQPFGLYKYGYIEDLRSINEKNLYEYYSKLINQSKIDIFISGKIYNDIDNMIKEIKVMEKLTDRDPVYNITNIEAKKSESENVIYESMDVNQGKLIIGLDLNFDDEELRYETMIYNSILGGSANSKLFQNVREKASLAYTANSNYYRLKNNIIINCGIEIENYDKALEIIKEQIQDMKDGKFEDSDVENAKQGVIASIKTIDDEQDTEIMYFFGNEFSKNGLKINDYINRVAKISKEDILKIANCVSINTIYFLKGM